MSLPIEPAQPSDDLTQRYSAIAQAACARLGKNERVRRNLPGGGRLKMDRQLPFLCLYRGNLASDSMTQELVTTQASYLFASDAPEHRSGVTQLCSTIASAMQEHFGTFLLIEVWAARGLKKLRSNPLYFAIEVPEDAAIPSTVEVLKDSLAMIVINGQSADVTVRSHESGEQSPRGDDPGSAAWQPIELPKSSCCALGLSVDPVYRSLETGGAYPMVMQNLRWKLATSIRKAVAEFTGDGRQENRPHHDAFGPSTFVQAVRLVDQQLCEVSESFDFLLQVTPVNSEQAWQTFKASGFTEMPPLVYRHLPYHPSALKRRLFAIEIERVEDPTLAYLFWEKQDELDRKITALRDLHLPETTVAGPEQHNNFLLSSLQLYGAPEADLVHLADNICKRLAKAKGKRSAGRKNAEPHSSTSCVDAQQLMRRAHEELDYYHSRMCEFNGKVELAESIAAGIMVSQDRLLIASDISISPSRVAPLLHHEIGTHLLTYFNGRCQPLQQLYAGLAGYEELQEGLAVFAEYMVGGLTRQRLRTLAARVLAIHWMICGQEFVEVFAGLRELGLKRRQAFTTALRVFRGGGLTKDVIYLRGLHELLKYLAAGHDFEPLYVGKIGLSHIPFIQELRRRGIVAPPRILPRFWDDPSVRQRLEACRGKSVLDLLEN